MLKPIQAVCSALILLALSGNAGATEVRNLVELKGSEQSVLTGIGVVVGLNGTGDSKISESHKAVLAAVRRNIDPTATLADFSESDSIALVAIRAVVPAEGVRMGVDRLDVSIAALKDAESLRGGMLLDAVLFGPGEDGLDYAVASGNLVLPDEEEEPRRAKIVRAAHIVRDIPSSNLDKDNRLTLVLQEGKASWELANFIASTINGIMVVSDTAEPIAYAKDQKNVVIQVPEEALPNLSEFITQIMVTPIDGEIASGGAKIRINRAEGTIAMTGDVELSPVTITHEGMVIELLNPEPEPNPNQPELIRQNFLMLDPDKRGGPRMRQLLDALNTLNVDIKGRISIIKTLHDMGALHAELEFQ